MIISGVCLRTDFFTTLKNELNKSGTGWKAEIAGAIGVTPGNLSRCYRLAVQSIEGFSHYKQKVSFCLSENATTPIATQNSNIRFDFTFIEELTPINPNGGISAETLKALYQAYYYDVKEFSSSLYFKYTLDIKPHRIIIHLADSNEVYSEIKRAKLPGVMYIGFPSLNSLVKRSDKPNIFAVCNRFVSTSNGTSALSYICCGKTPDGVNTAYISSSYLKCDVQNIGVNEFKEVFFSPFYIAEPSFLGELDGILLSAGTNNSNMILENDIINIEGKEYLAKQFDVSAPFNGGLNGITYNTSFILLPTS